jgi:phosphatidylserine/phosphatidylglycerophosphate/cardiolipin synthase-like enzyme
MLGRLSLRRRNTADLLTSRLYDQDDFYPAFLKDLSRCQSEAIIESPFITLKRTAKLLPVIKKLRRRGVLVVINTRDPQEHGEFLCSEASQAVAILHDLGVTVYYTGGHHRKLAVLDRHILWEGSLNILSQNDSCEIMRRIDSKSIAGATLSFISTRQK